MCPSDPVGGHARQATGEGSAKGHLRGGDQVKALTRDQVAPRKPLPPSGDRGQEEAAVTEPLPGRWLRREAPPTATEPWPWEEEARPGQRGPRGGSQRGLTPTSPSSPLRPLLAPDLA